MGVLWNVGSEYAGKPLDPEACDPDPIVEVQRWMADAIAANVPTPNAMTLATVDEHGRPSARIVLLKDLDARGLTFFTNYDSKKARDLAMHAFAALVLFWEPLHRQIRIEGRVDVGGADEADAYFATRARGSQIGAVASPQSQPNATREELERRVADVTRAVGEGAVARPPQWGGYRVVPDMIELWQGQASRLHDRVRYRIVGGAWTKDRLAP